VPRPAELQLPRDHHRDGSAHSKISLPSSSQSNEADDEQSISDRDSHMDDDHSPPPNYEGEDTRLTSDKELSGFYMYGWAAEVRITRFRTVLSLYLCC
jgi:UMF1 family MFS transporter